MLKRRSNAHRKSRVAYLASKQGLELCTPALFLCPLRYAMSKNGRCGSPVSEKPLETETQFLKTEALGHSFVPLCRVVGPLGRFLLDNRDAALHSVGALVRVRYEYSPSLANKVALKWSEGREDVASKLRQAVLMSSSSS